MKSRNILIIVFGFVLTAFLFIKGNWAGHITSPQSVRTANTGKAIADLPVKQSSELDKKVIREPARKELTPAQRELHVLSGFLPYQTTDDLKALGIIERETRVRVNELCA